MRKPKALKRIQDQLAKRYIFKLVHVGYNPDGVVRKLNEKGFLNKAGKAFTRNDVLNDWTTASISQSNQKNP